MFAITGITGQVGGVVARTLLAEGKNVRAVVRDAAENLLTQLSLMEQALTQAQWEPQSELARNIGWLTRYRRST